MITQYHSFSDILYPFFTSANQGLNLQKKTKLDKGQNKRGVCVQASGFYWIVMANLLPLLFSSPKLFLLFLFVSGPFRLYTPALFCF